MITEALVEKFTAEIKRLGCDYETVGAYSCVVCNPNTFDFDGYPIPEEQQASQSPVTLSDDYCSTVDLNVDKTLANLAKLPDNAGLDAFWDAVVDNVDGAFPFKS